MIATTFSRPKQRPPAPPSAQALPPVAARPENKRARAKVAKDIKARISKASGNGDNRSVADILGQLLIAQI